MIIIFIFRACVSRFLNYLCCYPPSVYLFSLFIASIISIFFQVSPCVQSLTALLLWPYWTTLYILVAYGRTFYNLFKFQMMKGKLRSSAIFLLLGICVGDVTLICDITRLVFMTDLIKPFFWDRSFITISLSLSLITCSLGRCYGGHGHHTGDHCWWLDYPS